MAAFNDKAHVSLFPVLYKSVIQFLVQSFICGSNQIAKAVRAQSVEILRSLRPDLDQSQAVKELESVLKGRFATDVFD